MLAFAGQGAAAATPSQPDVAAILARHHHAIGAIPMSAATWSGKISESGLDARYVTIADGEGRYRTTLTIPLAQRARGSDGSVEWVQDENGSVETGALQGRHSLAALLLGYNAVLFDSSITWSADVPAPVDGHNAYALRTRFGRAAAVFYVDAATGLLDRVDVGQLAIRYSEYRTFGRTAVPTRIDETDQDRNVTTTVEKLEFRPQLVSDFAVPQPRKPDFPDGKSDVEANFDSPHGLIVVVGAINDHPVRLLLDSGSSTSLIDLDAANRLGLPTGGSTRVAAAGILSGKVARADTLSVAGIRFHDFVLQAVPLQLPGPIERAAIDGIVGFDVLSRVVVRLNYQRDTLRFITPESFTYAGTGVVMPIDLAERVPRLKAILGDNDPATLSVDTGSDTGLILYENFANAHFRDLDNSSSGLGPPVLREDIGSARGAGGHFSVRTTVLNRLALGNFSLADVYTEVLLNPSGAFAPTRTSDGILGGGVLSKFSAVFLDYAGQRLILEK